MSTAAKLVMWGMLLACIALLAAALTTKPVHGHDAARPNLDSWYESLRTPGGGPCCGGPKTDGTVLSDADWESIDGHYRVRVNGEWLDVDDDHVVKLPNLAGPTMVWLHYADGKPHVRCFMPGAMI